MKLKTNEKLNALLNPLIKKGNNKITPVENIDIEISSEFYYNCWGFVAKIFNWTRNLIWVTQNEMKNYLDEYTKEVSKPQIGDIAVWETKNEEHWELIHTALIIDPKDMTIIQKIGASELEYGKYFKDSLYNYGNTIHYRRIK